MPSILKDIGRFIFVQPDKTILYDYKPEGVDGWVVTGDLMEKIKANPLFDLVIKDGELVDITPLEPSVIPPQSTTEEKLTKEIIEMGLSSELLRTKLEFQLSELKTQIATLTGGSN